jgi:hypothetical protein
MPNTSISATVAWAMKPTWPSRTVVGTSTGTTVGAGVGTLVGARAGTFLGDRGGSVLSQAQVPAQASGQPQLRAQGTKSSKYTGVSWHQAHNKWQVMITDEGRNSFVGEFDDEIEAAYAYHRVATSLGKRSDCADWVQRGFFGNASKAPVPSNTNNDVSSPPSDWCTWAPKFQEQPASLSVENQRGTINLASHLGGISTFLAAHSRRVAHGGLGSLESDLESIKHASQWLGNMSSLDRDCNGAVELVVLQTKTFVAVWANPPCLIKTVELLLRSFDAEGEEMVPFFNIGSGSSCQKVTANPKGSKNKYESAWRFVVKSLKANRIDYVAKIKPRSMQGKASATQCARCDQDQRKVKVGAGKKPKAHSYGRNCSQGLWAGQYGHWLDDNKQWFGNRYKNQRSFLYDGSNAHVHKSLPEIFVKVQRMTTIRPASERPYEDELRSALRNPRTPSDSLSPSLKRDFFYEECALLCPAVTLEVTCDKVGNVQYKFASKLLRDLRNASSTAPRWIVAATIACHLGIGSSLAEPLEVIFQGNLLPNMPSSLGTCNSSGWWF